MHIKPKKRLVWEKPETLAVSDGPNTTSSMDFTSDQLADERNFKTVNVLDDFNRERLDIEVDISILAFRVILHVRADHRIARLAVDNPDG